MARRKIEGSRMLITGASSGIGRALAEQAALRGARVVLAARSRDRLERAVEIIRSRGGEAIAIPADVTVPPDRRRMLDTTVEQYGGLDILVNNAGIGATGHFFEATEDQLRQLFELNFFALVETIRLAIPILRDGQQPMIVNLGSVVGRRGMPARSEYSASKFAVTGFSEALRAEMVRFGIDVLVVHPGLTDTPFEEHMIENRALMSFQKGRVMSAESLAHKILRAMEKGKHEIVTTLPAKLLLGLNRLAPRAVDRFLARVVRRLLRRHAAEQQCGQELLSKHSDP